MAFDLYKSRLSHVLVENLQVCMVIVSDRLPLTIVCSAAQLIYGFPLL